MVKQNSTEENRKEDEKKRKRKWLYILLFILLLLILLLLLLRGCGNQHPCPCPSSASSPVSRLDDTGSAKPGSSSNPSQRELLSRLQKQEVTVTDKVSAQAAFSSGAKGSTGTWEVENPASNTVIMQCEINLDGTSVAKTAPIYPGQHIDSLVLSQTTASGNHSAVATIRYYNKETKAYLGMADYKIHLCVS